MKIAFVFPGQGSQSVGMLNAWQEHAAVKETLMQASQALQQDLATLMAQGPADQLNLTANTQPVMLAADIAIYAAWRAENGPVPHVVAGHSLGEYAALTVAQALSFEDALRLVRIRAEAMQQAVPVDTGAMAAIIGLDADTVRALCRQACTQDEIVEAVNFNAPTQIVIAGHKGAVKRVGDTVKQLAQAREATKQAPQGETTKQVAHTGAADTTPARDHALPVSAVNDVTAPLASEKVRVLPLRVSAPFHSSLLKGAAPILAQALKNVTVSSPHIPVINNVDVAMATTPAEICDALVRQAWHPVRWVETLRLMQAQGVTHIIECGPGKVLTALTKKNVNAAITHLSLSDPPSFYEALEQVGHFNTGKESHGTERQTCARDGGDTRYWASDCA